MPVDGTDNTGVPVDECPSSFGDECLEQDTAKEYVVEKVLGHRLNKKGKLQYLLKWEDWSSEYNTWEDQENIFADKLIKQYWKKEELRRNESSEDDCNDLQSKKPNGNDKKRFSSHSLGGTSPKRHHRMINDSSTSNSATMESYKVPGSIPFQDKEKQQETQTLQSTTMRSTSPPQAQQLYPPPLFLQRIEPPKDLFDSEIRDPIVSLDWDNDSINVECLELDDQGIVGCLNWKSGSRTSHCLEELHAKCPQKMLEYYKENMRLEPEEKKDHKALQKARSARRARTRW